VADDTAETGPDLRLDPALATETRLDGTADDAVALLTALQRDPTYGRWRRAEAELNGRQDEHESGDGDEDE
jgi:hypothetical protein